MTVRVVRFIDLLRQAFEVFRFESMATSFFFRAASFLCASAMVLLSGCQSDLRDRLTATASGAKGEPASRDAGASPVDAGTTGGSGRSCPPGTFLSDDADAGGGSCQGCPSGTFAADEDATECEQWTECQPGEFVTTKGNATRDQACKACPQGQTSTVVNAGACLPRDACASGTVQVAPAKDGAPAECEPCESGSYCAGGTTAEHACADGTWDHDGDPATDCVDQTSCAAGQFVQTPGSATSDRGCEDCADGSFSLTTNADECSEYAECPAGTFVESAGTETEDVVCTACAAGTFTDAPDQSECAAWTDCNPGEFVAVAGTTTNDRQCQLCGDGEFSSLVNAGSCMANGQCAPGTRQTEAASADRPSVCEDCVPGEYCAGGDVPAQGCVASTWDHDADPGTPCVDHTTCLAGSFASTMGGATTDRTCAPCADGTFSVDDNVLACQPWQICPAGTHVQTLGSSTSDAACAGCSSGTFSAEAGAASCDAWTDCQPGEYVEATGTAVTDRVCAPCPSGQYSASVNAGMCVDVGACAPGTVETVPATQSTPAECADCSAGSYCAGGQAAEVACDSTSWDDDADPATPCVARTTCASGQYVVSAGDTTTDRTCAACASGKFSSSQNAASCKSWQTCSAGTYVATAGSSTTDRVCTACASGTFSTVQNAASCTTWSTCAAPNYYLTNTPSATRDRQCATCTPPEVTSADNQTTCHVPAYQMNGGTVVMEAENYTVYDQNTSQHTWNSVAIGGISGGTAMQLLPDVEYQWSDVNAVPAFAPLLRYNINFTTTGTFYVFIRGDDVDGVNDDNSCWGGIDNVPITNYFGFAASANAWGWVSQQVTVSTTGLHTFTVWGREDGFRFDKIVISTSPTAPSGNGPAQSTYN